MRKAERILERPAAAYGLAAVARTCHSVQQVALHDMRTIRNVPNIKDLRLGVFNLTKYESQELTINCSSY